jgi:Holliday junction resolvasome RuvABC endonuclease subunit
VELADHKVPCLVIPPSTLKKFGAGSGTASKARMIVTAQELSGITNLNDDEADAFWLAYLAFAWNEKPTGLKRHQLEVLHSLRNKKIKNKISKPTQFNI